MIEYQFLLGFILGYLVCGYLYKRRIIKAPGSKISGDRC